MVFGLSSSEEVNLFMLDPEGENRVKDYILKILDNFFVFSKNLGEKRQFESIKE